MVASARHGTPDERDRDAAVMPHAGGDPTAPPGWRGEAPYLALLLGAYLLPLLLVSPVGEFPLIDSWTYALAVRHLVEEGRLQISEWTATTLVFQVLWGAAFAKLFGFSFTALRASTLVLSFVGSAALYATGRELGLRPPRALLGALLYWLDPLTFSLSYTFMSDVPAISLLLLATYGAARGARRGRTGGFLVVGVAAALAFLVRQPGLLSPPAVLLYGALARWPARQFAWRALAVAGPPAVAVAGYLAWTRHQGLPQEQGRVLAVALRDGPGLWRAALLLGGYLALYLGLCCFPLALACGPSVVRALAGRGHRHALVPLAWVGTVAGLVFGLAWRGQHLPGYPAWMPYLRYGGMVQVAGIGPDDLLGARAPFLAPGARIALTALAAVGLGVLGLAAYGRRAAPGHRPPGPPPPIGLVAAVALGQLAALFPVSAHVLVGTWVSFDRYLLPLLPFALLLGLWATRGLRLAPALLLVGLLGLGGFSLAGTQDWLAYNRLRWQLAHELVAQGVPRTRIDAGMEWDGWFLYETSHGVAPRTPGGPFWTQIIAPATDSTYVIAFSPLPGYAVRERRAYPSWLHREPVALYVLRRH